MAHVHWCDLGGHEWVCDGQALRPDAGDLVPSPCVCFKCELPMNEADHASCPIELIVCPEHMQEQHDLEAEADAFLRTPTGQYMASLFAKRDSLPKDSPELDSVMNDIMRVSSAALRGETCTAPERENDRND